MAKNNPHYHKWIFRRPAKEQARVDIEDDDTIDDEPTELTDFHRLMEQRRRIEILHEDRLLKHNLNDLW